MSDRDSNEYGISVNDVPISDTDIAREMQYHPAASREEAYLLAARALVVRELLLQRAAAAGIAETNEISDGETRDEARIRKLIEHEVETPKADDLACRNYYRNNRQRFKTRPLIQVRHILIPAAPNDPEGRRAASVLAETILERLAEDLSRFGELARLHSACPSKDDAGDLGQIEKGQTVPEFERQVFGLPEGLSNRPVETRYGYHIVEILYKREGRTLEYSRVADQIANYLNDRVRRKAVSQYIQSLIGQARIRGIELEGADSPLLQ